MYFDEEKFTQTLYKESKAAFLKIIDEQKSDKIYSLALYNSGDDWGYLFPTVATEAGLDFVAGKYKKNKYYQDKSISSLKQELRWSPCDSPVHEEYVSELHITEELLRPISELMFELYENDKEGDSDEIHNRLVAICLKVLRQLENDGVFNSIDRNAFTLNLLNGDQTDEERLERAKALNPKGVYKIYEREI